MIYSQNGKRRSGVRSRFFTLFVILLVWCVTPAQAGISATAWEITATSGSLSGSYQIAMGAANYNPATDTWSWNSAGPIAIMDGFDLIATVDSASFVYVGDPQVNFDFTVTAGINDVEITVSSALLSFTTINSASGSASASLELVDAGGGGASLFGLGPGGAAYLAQYNGFVPGGTAFANLLTTPLSGPSSVTESFPVSGFAAIGVPVFDMSAQFHFSLSANDQAIGSSSFVIIPAPGALGLLAIGLIGSRRRRRLTD
ncbi:MAG: hypothetical protein IIB54_00535 [Planctomycetes bacterium]|nr:hypothetical protein [Planctomycetota bacterium]